jgi:quercetin dioxygenase-like cupin family protein
MQTRQPSLRFLHRAAFVVGAGFALTSAAVHPGGADAPPTILPGADVKWGAAPPSLPPGPQASALHGSPGKEGPFVLRIRFPAGFVLPPHRHSKDEFVTVISGRLSIVPGERVDRAAFRALETGSFVHLPAGTPHYLMTETESVVQVNGVGPFDVVYVNPRDDPRAQ